MRPTDENQHSTRPNLMSSSRRSGNEESILARLERDAGHGLGRKFPPPARLAAYGAGGLLVVGLVGMLVWLAHDNSGPQVEAVALAEAAEDSAARSAPPPATAPETAAAPSAPQAATIVDEHQPPAGAHAPEQHEAPQLVLLAPTQATATDSRHHAAAEPAALSQAQPSPIAASVRLAQAAPAQESAREPAPAQALQRAQTHSAKPGMASAVTEPKRGAKPGMPRTDGPRKLAAPAQRLAALHLPTRAAKAKRPIPPAPASEQVDSDVALISAVIMHSNNHNPGHAATPDCDLDVKCAAKATPEP